MSFPFPISGSSKKRKHPQAVGSDGTGQPRIQLYEKGHADLRPNAATAGETQRNRKPIASAEAKSVLRGIKESTNSYPPLRSIARDLWFILDSCEV